MSASKKLHVLSCAVLLAVPSAQAALTIYGAPAYLGPVTGGGYRGSSGSIPSLPGLSVASPGGSGLAIANETLFGAGTSSASASTRTMGMVLNPLAPGNTTILALPAGALPTSAPGSANNTTYGAAVINPSGSLIVGSFSNAATSPASTAVTVWKSDGTNFLLPHPVLGNFTARSINDSGTALGNSTSNSLVQNLNYVFYNSGTAAAPNYGATAAGNGAFLDSIVPGPAPVTTTPTCISASGVVAGSSTAAVNIGFSPDSVATYWTPGNTYSTGTFSGTAFPDPVVLPSGTSLLRPNGTGKTTSVTGLGATNGKFFGSASLFNTGTTSVISTSRSVRWNSTASAGDILDLPGPAFNAGTGSYVGSSAIAMNNAGDVAGSSNLFFTGTFGVTNNRAFARAVVWKAGTTTPTVLDTFDETPGTPVVNPGNAISPGNPGNNGPTNPPTTNYISYFARGINDAGYVVGYAAQSSASSTGIDALLWDPSGKLTELNSLVTLTPQTGTSSQQVGTGAAAILPTYGSAGWVSLTAAYSITNDGWISGVGVYYDPVALAYGNGASPGNPAPMNAGAGLPNYGLGTYYRAFTLQVPEPSSATLLLAGASALFARRRRTRIA